MTRRELLKAGAFLAVPLRIQKPVAPVRFAVITDIHHGLAPDSLIRMEAFVNEVNRRKGLDFVLQMGDFCHSNSASETSPFLEIWNQIDLPKRHVMGNHDMDRGTKEQVMALWGMPKRYGAFHVGGYRFIYLDLNHFRKAGKLHSYAYGNYFTDNATHNLADPSQLAWLERELSASDEPTFILSHQPLGFGSKDQPLPSEQVEILDILKRNGRVVGCMSGHLHVNRLEAYSGIPCLSVNSASYFWQSGMHPYKDPLFAFFSIDQDGVLRVEGRESSFLKQKPKNDTIGCSASISDRRVWL
ncbi:MAG: metallophosphoesterase [Fimbriimonas sp.]